MLWSYNTPWYADKSQIGQLWVKVSGNLFQLLSEANCGDEI